MNRGGVGRMKVAATGEVWFMVYKYALTAANARARVTGVRQQIRLERGRRYPVWTVREIEA